jgi:pilus assembly protein FimV
LLVATALLITPWGAGMAQAAGLGKLTILSALGQPLSAEIELVSVQKDEVSSLTARLASPDAFRAANIPFSPALVGARLSIERRANGQHYIRLSSSRVVNEPFIDLLVELTWGSGRLVREYTALIDPPDFKAGTQPQVAAPAVTPPQGAPLAPPAAAPSAPVREPKAAAAPKEPPAPKAARSTGGKPAAPSPAGAEAGAGEYAVKKGDSLYKIASNVKPEGVTLEQMLTALYRGNPDAFQGNMNRLKTGRILKVPDAATATATPQPEALKEVRVQTADWNAYRNKLAESPTDVAPGESKPAAGKISAATADKAAKEGPKDVVRLSKGEAPGAAGAGKDGKAAKPLSTKERMRMLEEEATAKEKALAEANDRIAQLEKSIGDMQKLLQLKGQPVPGGAKPAEAAKGAPVVPPTVVAKAEPPKGDAAKGAPAPAEAAKGAQAPPGKTEPAKGAPEPAKAEPPADAAKGVPPPPDTKPAPAPAPEAAKGPAEPMKGAPPDAAKGPPAPEVKPAEAPEPTKAAEAPKPKPKPAPPPPPPPPPPSLVDQILDEPLYLAGGGGALLLLLGGGYVALKRRRSAGAEVSERKIPPKLGAGTAAAAPSAAALMQSTVIMPAQPPEAPMMSEADVYIDEADMFMKIGRDAQAEERLKEALDKEPGRQDAQLKLLEIYSVRKDKAAFEKIAKDLQSATSGSGDNWLRAASLGYALDAGNALYAAGKDSQAAAPHAAGGAGELDFDLDLDSKGVEQTDVLLETGDRVAATNVIDPSKTMVQQPGHELTPAPGPMPDFTMDVAAGLGLNTKQPDITIDSLPDAAKPEITQTNVATSVVSGPNVIDFSLDQLPPVAADVDETTRDGTLILTPENAEKAKEMTLDVDVGAKPPTDTNAPLLAPDFKLDLGESTQVSGATPGSTETVPDLDLGGLSLSMDGTGAAQAGGDGTKDAHWYDVQTKFDLAKAYQEMGDKDGAREILQEVMKEGDAAQQAEAKKVLDSLG